MSKITGLKRRSAKIIKVHLDGRFAFSLGVSSVNREGLAVGQELDEDRIQALIKADSLQRCLEAATGFLDYRPRSESELRQKLERRGFASGDVEAVMGRLKNRGSVNDGAFARFWTENRDSFRPRSRRLTRLELRQKGVSEESISTALEGIDDGENAYRAALCKARSLKDSDFGAFRRRLGAHLRRRGFGYNDIDSAIDRVWKELGGRTGDSSLNI